MEHDKVQFLPFHAINEFMRPDYRLEVVRSALNALPGLPEVYRAPIDQMTRRVVKVPGFRNSTKAPAARKIKPVAEAFEKSPDLVAAILAAWAEFHAELRQQVYDLLTTRNWEVLPPDADRTQLPGFLTHWPKDEDFEALNAAFKDKFPAYQANEDDVSLMVVWISGRLPYEFEEDHPEEDAQPSEL